MSRYGEGEEIEIVPGARIAKPTRKDPEDNMNVVQNARLLTQAEDTQAVTQEKGKCATDEVREICDQFLKLAPPASYTHVHGAHKSKPGDKWDIDACGGIYACFHTPMYDYVHRMLIPRCVLGTSDEAEYRAKVEDEREWLEKALKERAEKEGLEVETRRARRRTRRARS